MLDEMLCVFGVGIGRRSTRQDGRAHASFGLGWKDVLWSRGVGFVYEQSRSERADFG